MPGSVSGDLQLPVWDVGLNVEASASDPLGPGSPAAGSLRSGQGILPVSQLPGTSDQTKRRDLLNCALCPEAQNCSPWTPRSQAAPTLEHRSCTNHRNWKQLQKEFLGNRNDTRRLKPQLPLTHSTRPERPQVTDKTSVGFEKILGTVNGAKLKPGGRAVGKVRDIS